MIGGARGKKERGGSSGWVNMDRREEGRGSTDGSVTVRDGVDFSRGKDDGVVLPMVTDGGPSHVSKLTI